MKITKIDRKKFRIRNKIKKVTSKERYRLSVNSSNTKKVKSQKINKKQMSTLVAEELAKKAKDMKITKVYFDRGPYKYHGRVKLLAEELRKNGMEF